jgi:hypothetical protein
MNGGVSFSYYCRCVTENDLVHDDFCPIHGGQVNATKPGDDKILEVMRSEGKKFDEGKPQLGLVPKSLIWAVGTILTLGAKKYGRDNWKNGLAWSRVYDALLRHLTAWWAGEGLDLESGKSHLWHAASELAFLIEYEESGAGEDDRSL